MWYATPKVSHAVSPSLSLCDDYDLNLSDYARAGLRVGIWASSGRGKSFGVGVFCEELLAANIPVLAIDPEGELHTLRERFRVLVLGGSHADLPLPTDDKTRTLAIERVLSEGMGLVVDLSDSPTSRAQQEAALPFLQQLWSLLSEHRQPAALVVEEVHLFAPQSGSSITSDILHRFAKQGRKRGAILVTASQRTQAVSKELMSQLNFQAIGGFEIERDYDAIKALVDGHSFEELRALPAGQFFLAAIGHFKQWRARHTAHGGEAPSFAGQQESTTRVSDTKLTELIHELRQVLEQTKESAAPKVESATDGLRLEIRRLGQKLEQAEFAKKAAEAEVERLKIALQVAGVIKVVIQNEVIVRAQATLATAAAPAPATAPATASVTAPASAPVTASAPVSAPVTASASASAPASVSAPAPVITATVVRPADPSLFDLGIPADQLLQLAGVREMLNSARGRARRRFKQAGADVSRAAKLLMLRIALTPETLAERAGLRSQLAIRRSGHALTALVDAGFALLKDGRYVVHEGAVLRAVKRG